MLDSLAALRAQLEALAPEAKVTYHGGTIPPCQYFQAHIWGVPISGEHEEVESALREAIENLKSGKIKLNSEGRVS